MAAESVEVDKWAYLVGIIVLLSIWGMLFVRQRNLRRRLVVMGLLIAPLAPLGQQYFLYDYWQPPLILPVGGPDHLFGSPLDLLFAFGLAGVASAIYPYLARCSVISGIHSKRRLLLFTVIGIEGACVSGLTDGMRVNSIFSSSLGFVLASAVILALRRDLWSVAIISGLVIGLLLTAGEGALSFLAPLYLSRYWLLYHTPWGIMMFNRVPLTEGLWGVSFGMAVGPLYDALAGTALVAHGKTAAAKPY